MALVGLVITFAGLSRRRVKRRRHELGRRSLGDGARRASSVSLFGIMGVLNPAYQKDAIWKK